MFIKKIFNISSFFKQLKKIVNTNNKYDKNKLKYSYKDNSNQVIFLIIYYNYFTSNSCKDSCCKRNVARGTNMDKMKYKIFYNYHIDIIYYLTRYY